MDGNVNLVNKLDYPIVPNEGATFAKNATRLEQICLKNFGLCEEETVTFKPGLNVVTGESGSGKTLLLKALSIVCGQATADKNLVRTTKKDDDVSVQCSITAKFWVGQQQNIIKFLEDENIEWDQSSIELRREFNTSAGRGSKCFINQQMVTSKLLATFGAFLVDINGQNSQLLLKEENSQLDMLDQAGGLNDLKRKFQEQYEHLLQVEEKLRKIESFSSESEREDMMNTLLEIEALGVEENEDEYIQKRLHLMEIQQQCAEQMVSVQAMLQSDSEIGVDMLISKANKDFSNAFESLELHSTGSDEEATDSDNIDDDFPARQYLIKADEGFAKLRSQLDNICNNIETGLESMVFDEEAYNNLQTRQRQIEDILRRTRTSSVQEMLQQAKDFSEKLSEWELLQEEAEMLEDERQILREQVENLALELSIYRKKAAASFEKAVETRLKDLAIRDALFQVKFTHNITNLKNGVNLPMLQGNNNAELEEFIQSEQNQQSYTYMVNNNSGVDFVQFLFGSSHDGMLRPLAEVASGGETSRLMLAIKGAPALVEQTTIATQKEMQEQGDGNSKCFGVLILDEIDSGIGARLATPLGTVLSSMVRGRSPSTHQIICVTHLPQVAQKADWHIKAIKRPTSVGQISSFEELVDEAERDKELEEMAGDPLPPHPNTTDQSSFSLSQGFDQFQPSADQSCQNLQNQNHNQSQGVELPESHNSSNSFIEEPFISNQNGHLKNEDN